MTRILAMCFDSEASPSIHLAPVPRDHRGRPTSQPYGWGLAWYPQGDSSAAVIKDPTSIGDNPLTKLLSEWKRFRSTVFVCHMLGAAKRRTQQDTHPFLRTLSNRTWVFAHNGDLKADLGKELPLGDEPAYEPIGRTDSEHAFCWMLTEGKKLAKQNRDMRRLRHLGWERIHGWFKRLNQLGTGNFILTDGHDVIVYHDKDRFNGLHWIRRRPPHALLKLSSPEMMLDLDDVLDLNRTMVLFSSRPLSDERWQAMAPGQMLVASHGAIIWDSEAKRDPVAATVSAMAALTAEDLEAATQAERVRDAGEAQPTEALAAQSLTLAPAAEPAVTAAETGQACAVHRPVTTDEPRILRLLHETIYKYPKNPVEMSSHVFRLKPVQDDEQLNLEHELIIEPGGLRNDLEDVFGNSVTRLQVETPYNTMRICARSVIRLSPLPPLTHNSPTRRMEIPLVWMPWQRQMMTPYLLPQELPETQLSELSDYAMSFVERQDYDLVETLLDMNKSIYKDYAYVPGSTSLETTPWEVFVHRRGVCQDFANLLICLARLLNVPARYRVGYIYTGGDYENKIQSDASHAWAELYLPWTGWRGFDPTNGCLAGRDHIRVACGRNFRDATPTSGTIYRGGGAETLTIQVKVEEGLPPAAAGPGAAPEPAAAGASCAAPS